MSRYVWVKRIVYLNTFSCLQTEVSDWLWARQAEEADLQRAGFDPSSIAHIYREHYLNASMGNDTLYYLTQDKRYIVRDRLETSLMKDCITFMLLGAFLPRLSFALCSSNLLMKMVLDGWRDQAVVEAVDSIDIGRISRLLLLAYPLKYFI